MRTHSEMSVDDFHPVVKKISELETLWRMSRCHMLDPIQTIRKEVRELISINERIQGAVLRGEGITVDEAELIKITASELLTTAAKLQGAKQTRTAECV